MSKPFHILLDDREYAKLEDLRFQLGLRSRAEVVRELIRGAGRGASQAKVMIAAVDAEFEAKGAGSRIKLPADIPATEPPVEAAAVDTILDESPRLPVGLVRRIMETDGRSGAPLAVFRKIARYDGDLPVWVEATPADYFSWQKKAPKE